MNDSFLPAGYVAPASGGFTKIETGDTTLRILSNPVLMWVIWENGEVRRIPYLDASGQIVPKPDVSVGDKNSVHHAWGLTVWNYKTSSIEVLELQSKVCQSGIENYAKNPAWGHPRLYDVIIKKTGSGKEGTKYALAVNPPAPVSEEIKTAFLENPVDLNQLFVKGGNCFLQAGGAPASTQPAPQAAKIVTPDNWVAGDPIPVGYKWDAATNSLKKSDTPF